MKKIFVDRSGAREMIRAMRGWDGARVVRTDEGYIVTTHAAMCDCNMCPVMHDDGYVR